MIKEEAFLSAQFPDRMRTKITRGKKTRPGSVAGDLNVFFFQCVVQGFSNAFNESPIVCFSQESIMLF